MRLFIATTFPEEILRSLNERLASVRSKLPPASWVRPETQHLTYAFLGEQDEAVVDQIAPKVCEHLRPTKPFAVTRASAGAASNRKSDSPRSRNQSGRACGREG